MARDLLFLTQPTQKEFTVVVPVNWLITFFLFAGKDENIYLCIAPNFAKQPIQWVVLLHRRI